MNKKLILIFIGIFSSTFLIAGDIEDIKDQIVEEKKQEGTFDDLKDFGLLALSMLVFL